MTEPIKTFDVEEIFPEEQVEEVKDVAKFSLTAKGVAKFVVGSSVKFVVTTSIASLVPTESRKDRAKVLVGSYVISGIIAEKAKAYIEDEIDDKIEFYREVRDKVKELQAPKPEELSPEDAAAVAYFDSVQQTINEVG